MSKNNVPYYIAGTLTALTLLASGVFAVAPYIGFLAPVAALSVGLPFIIGGAVFSAVAIALSAVAISKNNTISEKEAQLADEKSKVEAKNQIISEKVKEISGEDAKLVDQAKGKFNSVGNKLKNIYDTMPSAEFAKDIKTASEKAFTSTKEAFISGRVTRIVKDGLKDVYDTSVEYTKGALNSVGSSLYSRFYGTKVSSKEKFESRVFQRKQEEEKARIELKASGLLPDVIKLLYKISSLEEQFKREDGSKLSMHELTPLDYLDPAVLSSEQKQRANSLDYLNIHNVPKQPDHLNVDAAKRYLMSLSENDEKGTEISSPENQPTKEENGQGWFAWSLGKAKSAMTEVVVIGVDVTKPYLAKITKALAPNLNM